MKHYSDYVDPYIGSIGHMLTSTQALVHLPHSMAQIRPVLDERINDKYLAPVIYGFPMNKGTVMPDCGDEPTYESFYDHDFECVKCYRGSVLLEDSGITAEYTVTEHCAIYRFAYPAGVHARLRVKLSSEGTLAFADGLITGEEQWENTPCCFAATLSEKPERVEAADNALYMTFAPGTTLVVKAGFSYIDARQAAVNLEKETADLSFDEAADRAQQIWDRTLGQIEVEGGTEAQKRTFYTSLYRVHQRMINVSEYGRYFSAFDHQVHEDETDFYTVDGLWDTYRDAHPLQLILEPRRQTDMINSYLRMYQQSGWLPSFPFLNGNNAVMIGKHATAMITDAYLKGLDGFDAQLAWEGMVKNEEQATKLPWSFGEINEFDKCYFENGFFPALPEGEKEWLKDAHPFEARQCVAVTLETAYDEWCLYRLSEKLGHTEAAEKYARRSQNYRTLFNKETGFMSPKLADGSWVTNFDPKLSGGLGGRAYFAECNSWTYTLHVQHDIEGLANLMGGKKALENYLDRMFVEQYGTLKCYFLGQFPDETGLIGQFCMGNEPSFHVPYLYNYTGQPWKTQRKLREIMRLWFNDTPFGICGDEDGGAMCSWFVFSAMGFYPVCPGKPEYQIGSPLFEKVTIHLENGADFVIRAEGNTDKTKYIQSAALNGEAFDSTVLAHSDLVHGGELVLRMGERPNREWAAR